MAQQYKRLSERERRRAQLLGDELTRALDAFNADPNPKTQSDLYAALIGRCASMAAAAVVAVHDRVEALEAARDAGDRVE